MSVSMYCEDMNGGFYMLLKKKTGINWTDKQIGALGKLSEKVYDGFKDIFIQNQKNKDYTAFLQQFLKLSTFDKDTPDSDYLFKLIDRTSVNLNSSNVEVKNAAKTDAENLLTRMSTIVGKGEYKTLQKKVSAVFDFSKGKDGNYSKYNDEITALVDMLGKEGKYLFSEDGKSKKLRKHVLDFLENKFMNVVLEFTEECPILIEKSEGQEEYSSVRPINSIDLPIQKQCIQKYFKKLYDNLEITKNPQEFDGKPIHKFVEAYKDMDRSISSK